VEKEIIHANPSVSAKRYPVNQEIIDDILNNELKEFSFPVRPSYNARIRANGITKGEIYSWGQLKRIVSIEIGKQDRADRKFLVDTLLHEYYESKIMINQYSNAYYNRLSKAGDAKRHKWIDDQIAAFFKGMEVR